jgi:hypothetical protein
MTLGHKLVVGKQDWLPTLWTNGKGGSSRRFSLAGCAVRSGFAIGPGLWSGGATGSWQSAAAQAAARSKGLDPCVDT